MNVEILCQEQNPSPESLKSDEYELVVDCPFDPPHQHTFPSDWFFGGPNGTDWRADERWNPTVYVYFSDRLQVLHTSVTPGCDDEAIDNFTLVNSWFKHASPKWIRVRRPDGSSETLPVIYDAATDEVYET